MANRKMPILNWEDQYFQGRSHSRCDKLQIKIIQYVQCKYLSLSVTATRVGFHVVKEGVEI